MNLAAKLIVPFPEIDGYEIPRFVRLAISGMDEDFPSRLIVREGTEERIFKLVDSVDPVTMYDTLNYPFRVREYHIKRSQVAVHLRDSELILREG